MRNRGFSLVELSIVLVILGLLVGGVLSGQSLIRASELRAVTAEYQRYFTAMETFKDKYFAIAGDFNNAQAFWGQSSSCGGAVANGTCNGNGNGVLDFATGAAGTTGEQFQFWNQLALAGLIEGKYTGLTGPLSIYDSVPATNIPKSRMSNAGWSMNNIYGPYVGDAGAYAVDYGNGSFVFGAINSGGLSMNPALKPEEAWNIDTKIDDGLPGSGKVVARYWNATCATAATASDFTSPYNLSNTALQCALYFVKQW